MDKASLPPNNVPSLVQLPLVDPANLLKTFSMYRFFSTFISAINPTRHATADPITVSYITTYPRRVNKIARGGNSASITRARDQFVVISSCDSPLSSIQDTGGSRFRERKRDGVWWLTFYCG